MLGAMQSPWNYPSLRTLLVKLVLYYFVQLRRVYWNTSRKKYSQILLKNCWIEKTINKIKVAELKKIIATHGKSFPRLQVQSIQRIVQKIINFFLKKLVRKKSLEKRSPKKMIQIDMSKIRQKKLLKKKLDEKILPEFFL